MQTRRSILVPCVRGRRRGLTLYEVVLATVIFLMAMAGISQVISLGTQASVTAKLESEAAMHAERLLGEVVAGVHPLMGVGGQPFLQDDDSWVWSMTVEQTSVEQLQKVTLTVNHLTNDGRINAGFTVQRLVRDPQLFIDAAEEAAQKEADAAAEMEAAGGGM